MEASSAYEAGKTFGQFFFYAIFAVAAVGGGIFFLVAMIKAFSRKTRGWIITSIVAGVIACFGVVGLIGAAANSLAKMVKTAGDRKKTMASKDGRFQIEVPASWKDMPELHQEAQIEAGNSLADEYVLVLENPKSDFEGTLADFDELVIGQMKERLQRPEVSSPEARELGQHPALTRRVTGTIKDVRIVYHTASVETGGAFYQILAWTRPSKENTALPGLAEIVASFRVIDPSPVKKSRSVSSKNRTTRERVVAMVADQLGSAPASIQPESGFIEDLGADSLDTVELIMAVEEEFDVTISDADAEKLRTIGDLTAWLERQSPAVE